MTTPPPLPPEYPRPSEPESTGNGGRGWIKPAVAGGILGALAATAFWNAAISRDYTSTDAQLDHLATDVCNLLDGSNGFSAARIAEYATEEADRIGVTRMRMVEALDGECPFLMQQVRDLGT